MHIYNAADQCNNKHLIIIIVEYLNYLHLTTMKWKKRVKRCHSMSSPWLLSAVT